MAGNTLVTTAVIRGHDKLSGPLSRMAGKVRATNSLLAKSAVLAQRAQRAMSRHAHRGQFGMGLPGAFVAYAAARREYEVDRSKRFFEGTADWQASSDAIAQFNARMLEVAQTQRKTRAELMRGAQEALTAGIEVGTITNTLERTSQVSIAVNEDLGKVYGDLTDIIKGGGMAFGTAAEQIETLNRVANTMAVAATSANQTWGGFVRGLKHAWPPMSMLGVSLEQTTAMLGTLADAGFKGEMGGTALRTIMIRLVKPTRDASNAFAEAGVRLRGVFDFDEKKLRSLPGLMKKLETGGLFSGDPKFGKRVQANLDKLWKDPKAFDNLFEFREKAVSAVVRGLGMKKPKADELKYIQNLIDAHYSDAQKALDPKGMLEQMNKLSFAQSARVFGVRRLPQLLALRRNLGDYLKKLALIEKHSPGAINRRYLKMAQGFAHSFDMAASAVDVFFDKIGGSGLKADATRLLNSFAGFVNDLGTADPDKVKRWTYAIGGLMIAGPAASLMRLFVGSFAPFVALAAGSVRSIAAVSSGLLGMRAGLFGVASATTAANAAMLASPLFSIKGQKGGAAAIRKSTLASKAMIAGMGAQAVASSRMLSGMGTAGAAAMASIAARGKGVMGMLARLRAMLPTIGGLFRGAFSVAKFTAVGAAIGVVVMNLDKLWAFAKGAGAGFMDVFSGPEMQEFIANLKQIGSGISSVFGGVSKVLSPVTNMLGKVKEYLNTVYGLSPDASALELFFETGKRAVKGILAPLRLFIGLFNKVASGIRWLFGIDAPKLDINPKKLGAPEASKVSKAEPKVSAAANDNTPKAAKVKDSAEPMTGQQILETNAVRAVTVQGVVRTVTTLERPLELTGAINSNINVNVQGGAAAQVSSGGSLRGPANAIPVRTGNDTATGN